MFLVVVLDSGDGVGCCGWLFCGLVVGFCIVVCVVVIVDGIFHIFINGD